ncbi:DUF4123 domain-containing protein [Roseateles koreensis]|uniref:DUF4123 domain-containing protein n=1 Tax=Roseateles koreensis TaxID=2987526 RepID=A0ABT5KY39_9BURK|nr:DUF4123 domain-containing protein [Roseateles koreensis]MDC8787295.1 DUF4123 domain-containing protein [Roseateles koreensis]
MNSSHNYYAQDPLSQGFCTQVLVAYQALSAEQPGLHLLALINGAAMPDCMPWLQAHGYVCQGVLDESPYRKAAAVGPILVPLSPTLESLTPLAERFNADPSLSFMASSTPLAALCAHLASAMVVAMAGEPNDLYLLSVADTRCLPRLLPLLNAPDGPGWAPGESWSWFPDRSGRCVQHHNPARAAGTVPAPHSAPTRLLSPAQWQPLVDDGDADAMLAQIHHQRPELLTGYSGARLYEEMKQQITAARAQADSAWSQLFTHCVNHLEALRLSGL